LAASSCLFIDVMSASFTRTTCSSSATANTTDRKMLAQIATHDMHLPLRV
jgi:hypothetical protein